VSLQTASSAVTVIFSVLTKEKHPIHKPILPAGIMYGAQD